MRTVNIKSSDKDLTAQEMADIIADFQMNGETIYNTALVTKLIKQLEPYAYYYGHKTYPSYMKNPKHSEGLKAAGVAAIVEAMKTYDPNLKTSKGSPILFSTWAFRYILNALRDYVAIDIHGYSTYFYRTIQKLNPIINQLRASGTEPTDEEIILMAQLKGIPRKTTINCLDIIHGSETTIRLDKSVKNDDDNDISILDAITSDCCDFADPAEIYSAKTERQETVEAMHDTVSEDEYSILTRYYLNKEGVKSIADSMGVDELTITRIINAATDKVKLAFGNYNNKATGKDIDANVSVFVFNNVNVNYGAGAEADVDFATLTF